MKIAIIGCGSIGKRHVQNFLMLGHQVVAYNRSLKRRNEVKKKFKIETFSNIEKLFQRHSPSLTIICTPANKHISNAIMAINYKSHIFIEKPFTLLSQNSDNLIKRTKNNKLFNHVGCNMRFHYGPKKIKSFIEKNKIGEILFAKIWCGTNLTDWHPNEDHTKMYSAKKSEGGGVLLDLIHEIDLAYWLFGKTEKIKSFLSNTRTLNIKTEDVANILFLYPKNIQLNMSLNYLEKPVKRGIYVYGTKGSIEWSLEKNCFSYTNHRNFKTRITRPPKNWSHNSMYIEQSKYVIDCIGKNKKSFNSFNEAADVMKMASKVKKSNY